MRSLITYLKNVQGELSHVVWPKQSQAITHVIIVILVSALTAVLIAALDYLFTSLVANIV